MTTLTHGFELIEERNIPEINSLCRLYRHAKSGAHLLSMINDDENKVFGITFATPPTDSTGIAHIMEHSVLCGSRKYPLKEPFVELIKGSLNTFVNAFTYPDKTCYPVASQNVKDLYNLVDVYLDAVLYPNITPWTLRQEGWHYELEDKAQPLQFKGVVFNEMKGAYSSPESLLGRNIQQSLFPDTTYGVDSGGDPAAIPDLTYEQFKAFHDTFYHPANARIIFYGDDNPEERLRFLDTWLRDFDKIDVQPKMDLQPRFTSPKKIEERYDAGEDAASKKAYVSVNWLLTDEVDPETTLALEILAHMLAGTPASPLRKALIDSGLGEDVIGGGMENDLRESYYTIGLKGVQRADVDKVEPLIFETLKQLARDGFAMDQVEASLNTIEFQLREANTGRFPRGIVRMISALQTWLYDAGDPFTPLAFEAPLQSIKDRLMRRNEHVFANLIQKYLLDNLHRTTLIMLPDANWNAEREAAERARLDAVRNKLNDADLDRIIDETKMLKQMQVTPDSPEALATIPALTLGDLDRTVKSIPIEVSQSDAGTVLTHDIFTNGIAYLDVGFDLKALPARLVPYAGLFGNVLLEMGTSKEDFVSLSRRIGRKTGGISASALNTVNRNSREAIARFFLRGKSTVAQFGDLLDILRDVLLTAKLDNKERFEQIVLEQKAGVESGLVPAGHRFVNTRLASAFNAASWANEQTGGIAYLFFLRDLEARVKSDWAGVLADLQAVHDALISRKGLIANVTLDAKNWATLQPKLAAFIETLPDRQTSNVMRQLDWPIHADAVNEGLTIPAQVNYVGKGADLYALGYKLNGAWLPIQNWLRTTYLWERIRVQGGAYGGFCTFDPRSGVFTYLSYRDPNLLATVENYDGTPAFIRSHAPSAAEVDRTIIGVIGEMDSYLLPDAKGYTSMSRWLAGDTDDTRQQVRDEVLRTTPADFVKFADVAEEVSAKGRVVVLGSPQAIDKANAERGGDWLNVMKVM
jgi:Zn-dependent M16 (insulinase) family peptidase